MVPISSAGGDEEGDIGEEKMWREEEELELSFWLCAHDPDDPAQTVYDRGP